MKPALVLLCAVSASLAACAGAAGVSHALSGPPPSPAVRVARAGDGHYWTRARVDGRGMDVLVDTGASAVALTRARVQ